MSSNVMELRPMHPFSLRAFQRYQEHDLKHPGLVDLIPTKQNKTNQNKLPSFIDRLLGGYSLWCARTISFGCGSSTTAS